MDKLEFFYDCSSPWTYLAFNRIESVCAGRCELVWKPFLVGGVFNTVNQSIYEQRANPVPVKAAYYQKDLQDWAGYHGLNIGQPAVFPVNSVKAMRGAFIALEHGIISAYSEAVFRTYWSDLKDISRDEVLEQIVRSVGLDPADFITRINLPEYKQKLRDNTDELIRRGGFGSPTFFLNDTDMFFGNDRIPVIAAKFTT